MKKTVNQILKQLRAGANPVFAEKMARYGIDNNRALGWRTPLLKELAKPYRKNQALAMALYQQNYHETKLLTAFVGDYKQITLTEADVLTAGFYSWDVVDQICANLFAKASFAWQLPQRYAIRLAEYERRAGVVMVVQLAQKHKNCADDNLLQFLPLLKECALDDRNFVKKAVSWALRTLGKRSRFLNEAVQSFAQELLRSSSASAQWIGRDTLKEITQDKYINRLKR